MATHEAGALHAPGYGGVAYVPSWLRAPSDASELLPQLWSSSVRREPSGELSVGGVGVHDLAAEHGTPAYVLDEKDFRRRAAAFRDAFSAAFTPLGGSDVFYAGKAFLCTEVARWIAADGLGLDVCTGGELAVALRAGVPGERIALHGNNKSDAELRRALGAGVGRVVVDSLEEVDRVATVAGELGVRAGVLLRVTVGVEAHTHEYIATAHEDQKFGLSIAGGVAAEAARRALARPELHLLGLHSHIGSQIFDTGGFEVAARRVLQPARGDRARARRRAARARPRRRLRHRLHERARPAAARGARDGHGRHRAARVHAASASPCRASPSSPGGRSPGRAPSPSTRSAPSRTCSSTTAPPAVTSPSTAA